MRTRLKPLDNLRRKFTGTFERYGRKTSFKGWPKVTVLITDIKDSSGRVVTDHIWLNHTKQLQDIGSLREGDVIEFHARVREYVKGYRGHRDDRIEENPPRLDYKLSHPTQFQIIKIGKGEPVEVPDFKAKPVWSLPQPGEAIKIKSVSAQTDLKRLIG